MTPPRADPRRSVLIALSAGGLHPDAACRLALGLDLWWGDRSVAAGLNPPACAQELGVTVSSLELAFELAASRETIVKHALREAAEYGVRITTGLDADYPAALRQLELPPPALYVRGTLDDRPAIAIVGPRNADGWALAATGHFASELAAAGLSVVSGFARGVDAAAHRAALEAGGHTVAVLGCGHGVPYPRQHHRLADEIKQSGAVISEFPCRHPPRAWHFPIRNRLIAALSFATLVIQASERSGSLITARSALDLGRDVYALPGRVTDARSRGSNRLLRDGALVALDPQTLLETLPSSVRARLQPPAGGATALAKDGLAAELLELLDRGAQGSELLARTLEVPIDRVLGALLELELGGSIERLPGALFARAARRQ